MFETSRKIGSKGVLGIATIALEGASVLVFSQTHGFRHESIPAGVETLHWLGAKHGFGVRATEDPIVFAQDLESYAAVVFLNTTGNVLDDGQRDAFEAYVRAGGGFVGVHAAADTGYDWAFYGELVGAYFRAHPPGVQTATIKVEDRSHPSTRHLSERWEWSDEWYDYASDPRGRARVLAAVDEATYDGGSMGADHPIVWWRELGEGRSFYTGLGHSPECFEDNVFRHHLLGGIESVASRIP